MRDESSAFGLIRAGAGRAPHPRPLPFVRRGEQVAPVFEAVLEGGAGCAAGDRLATAGYVRVLQGADGELSPDGALEAFVESALGTEGVADGEYSVVFGDGYSLGGVPDIV